MLKVRKRMDVSKLYNVDKLKFVKCEHCIHYEFLDAMYIKYCKKHYTFLDKDIALGCPYFKTKGVKSNED